MKSASNFWIFILLTSILFNCASRKSASDTLNMQKAYVLLRTEGLDAEINKLTSILNSNFITNKIASDINYYPSGKSWNNNEIFSTAYNNNYDYIILIDQVAKFTLDNRTNIGGKYQIRSYNIKSSNPDWVDLGQKTCNIAIRESVDKFSQQIISQIVPEYIQSNITNTSKDVENQTELTEIDYNKLKSSKEIDKEIEALKAQLKKEKAKTKEATTEKNRLKEEYEKALSLKKKNNQTIAEGLEPYKKELELEKKEEVQKIQEAKILEEKKKEEKRLAKAKQKQDKG